MSFDWQTQEEISWDAPPLPLPEEPREPQPKRRWWLYLVLVILVGAGTAVFIIIRQLNQRIEIAEAAAREAVISSYNVIQQAAVAQDSELFVSFLSGRDANWSAAQEQAVREGAYLDRAGLGLQRLGEAKVMEDTAVVIFSPDLTAAEMTITHTYGVDIGNGVTQTVTLQQTAVYRLGPNRWLLAPPDAEFWGEMETRNGRYLTTTYPARDAEVGRRLAADLDRKLIEMCEQLAGSNCPPDLHITLDLTTDPAALLPLHEEHLPTGLALTLPAPSLTGLPQDENGYRALQRGYGRWMVTAVINHLTSWVCCDHELFQQTITSYQTHQLGLTTLPPIIYSQVQTNAPQLDTFIELWNSLHNSAEPFERQMVYTLIEFLTTQAPTFQLQQEFGDITYRNWLLNVTATQYTTFDELEQAWQQFLEEKARNE